MHYQISSARKEFKTKLTKVLVKSFIFSVLFTFGVILVSFFIATNPFVISPLLMGNYFTAAIQFTGYVAAIFTINILGSFSTVKQNIRLLWITRNM